MIVIDTNVLIILIIGGIDTKLISKHKRTNLYVENDYVYILNLIKDFDNLLVLPNIWTEVDNLMNRFPIKDKYSYIELLRKTTSEINEVYIKTCDIIDNSAFYDLGVTDVKILEISK